ncbi:hypothetical protein G6O69_29465 [Pseudenhygromyxa sp. WMMC2535]|uniref:hypothetical protein n=1 Tax=Pseudenhygromyxa sp. WMMC2535 TaxID=2712867 RepID=UPI0015951A9E|nr:hypothetical protein [Pseudenhygromyxa sp. WMMC2535]NVB41992.1 hypothetical protein [Pseudenhygromyxa sp. WMMC2535]
MAVASSCADEFPDTPACDADSGACLVCTEADASACGGSTPACVDNTCVPCSMHEQCPGSACQLEGDDTGTCFAGDALHVDGDAACVSGDGSEDTPFCTLEEAADQIGGGEGVVILHAAGPYNESITIDTGARIAFIAASGEAPEWRNASTSSLRATDSSIVYAHGIDFRSSTTSALSAALSGEAYVTNSIISNTGDIAILANQGHLMLRNTFVSQNESLSAIDVAGGTLDIGYSTIVTGLSINAIGIDCDGGSSGSVRNSIILTAGSAPELDCANVETEGLFLEANAPEAFGEDSTWFVNTTIGDLHLTGNPTEVFDAISTFATWTTGDPLTDIDGDLRVNVDGQPTFVGADVAD